MCRRRRVVSRRFRRSAEPASHNRRCRIPPTSSPARAVPNLQDDPEESRIARVTVALARVAEGGRVIGIEQNTTLGGLLVDVLGPTLAYRPPMPSLDLRPPDLRL